MISKNHLKP